MGRHSRKGAAPSVADTGQQPVAEPAPPRPGTPQGTGRRRRQPGEPGTPAHGTPLYGSPAYGSPEHGTPAHGTPAYGSAGPGAPAHGAPPRGPAGPGTPAHGTPVHRVPASAGAPGPGAPGPGASARGGHPQHDEGGPRPGAYGPGPGSGRARRGSEQVPFVPGPRRESLPEEEPEAELPAARGGLGRTLTGVAAAAVATVLAVVVAGQVTDRETTGAAPRAAEEPDGRASADGPASRSDDRAAPTSPAPVATPPPPTYEQLMTRQYPIDPKLKGSGTFKAVPGFQKAPGPGRLIRYRIDVEEGLGLDTELFASAVQKTLNDPRSWAGQGAMSFERISSGDPRFVITLASPGTTGAWCAKSGLDTTVDNVSCDSASTDRVMINAFRWAQGSATFGPKAMYAYRQMLINHEVGHRLGHGHKDCATPGALAPVMQQQTKSLNIGGIKCLPNPWVHPGS
ncbi:DUF3152 domain-containing protein [Streptomyces sp. NPDC059247]|uniref:DUF3152 domain-containing protein n=1 Tax=Streptomyces sp. NPDC059247 TaxID=3346790 RepID=UPI0036743BB9